MPYFDLTYIHKLGVKLITSSPWISDWKFLQSLFYWPSYFWSLCLFLHHHILPGWLFVLFVYARFCRNKFTLKKTYNPAEKLYQALRAKFLPVLQYSTWFLPRLSDNFAISSAGVLVSFHFPRRTSRWATTINFLRLLLFFFCIHQPSLHDTRIRQQTTKQTTHTVNWFAQAIIKMSSYHLLQRVPRKTRRPSGWWRRWWWGRTNPNTQVLIHPNNNKNERPFVCTLLTRVDGLEESSHTYTGLDPWVATSRGKSRWITFVTFCLQVGCWCICAYSRSCEAWDSWVHLTPSGHHLTSSSSHHSLLSVAGFIGT
jgi:hypothetical protein